MWGQPDPIVPVWAWGGGSAGADNPCARPGHVSVWVGEFGSVEAAEAYFGIPEEVNVYLPAEAFEADFDLGDYLPESLAVNFEQVTPRPLRQLLQDATYAASFLDAAVTAAAALGITRAQGVALVYDFDYGQHAERRASAGPLRFVGAFPFVPDPRSRATNPSRRWPPSRGGPWSE